MVVFAPQERHVAPINVKVGTGERIAGPLPRANFHVNRGKNVGIQPLKLSKFLILARNLYLRGDSFAIFYEIFSVCSFCTRLQVAFKFLVWSLSRDKQPSYKNFPAVGAFSHKFSIAPSGETTARIKKVRGVQKWDGPPLSEMLSMMGILDRAQAVNEKV